MFLDNSSQGGLNFFYTGRAAADAATNYYGEQSQLEDSNVIDRGFKFATGRTALFASRKALGKDTGGNFFKAMAPQSVRNWSFGQNKMSGLGKLGVGYLAFGMDDGGDALKTGLLYGALTAMESPGLRNLTSNFYDKLKKTNPTYKKFDDTLGLSDRFKSTPLTSIKNDWNKKYGITNLGKDHKQFRKKHARERYMRNSVRERSTLIKKFEQDISPSTLKTEKAYLKRKVTGLRDKKIPRHINNYINQEAVQNVTNIKNETLGNIRHTNKRIDRIKHVAARTDEIKELGRKRAIAWGGGTKNKITKLAKKVGGRAGYALGAAAIGAAIIAPVIKHSYEVYNRGVDQLRDAQNLDFGSGMTQLSGQALNERQRALDAIANANMSARNYMGSEAMSYH